LTEPQRYLLDSNICIAFLAAGGEGLRQRMRAHEKGLVTSAICFGEVLLGFERRNVDSRPALELFEFVKVLPYDREAAAQYARLPFRRGQLDRLIAAHSLSVGAVLVTNNVVDFADVPGLKIENWLA
jgi:tRNA(fMet)-specific endonuclease VapC